MLVVFSGDPQLHPSSLGPITAAFIPDLPLVPDKVKQFPLGKTRPRLCQRSIQVVHHEGQGLHNELENVSYITPHLNSGFSGTRNKGDIYPFSRAGLEWRVLLIQLGVWNWVICVRECDFLAPEMSEPAMLYDSTAKPSSPVENEEKNCNTFVPKY